MINKNDPKRVRKIIAMIPNPVYQLKLQNNEPFVSKKFHI